jgi:hypothetical protein
MTMRSLQVSALALGVVALALAGGAQAETLPRFPPERAFFEEIAFGETLEIVRNGPISVEVKCEVLDLPDSGKVLHQVSLLAVTTVEGVLADLEGGDFPDQAENFLDPITSEEDRVLASSSVPEQTPAYGGDTDQASLIAPSGEVILIGRLGLGLNVLGADCLVVGTYLAFKGLL